MTLPTDLHGLPDVHEKGLPPGPIDTPTLASIDAALEPEHVKAGYLYFLAKNDGRHECVREDAQADATWQERSRSTATSE